MANIDYDEHYEWLCEKAKIREELAYSWLRDTISDPDSEAAADELYVPIGDDLTPLLLEVGKKFPGFKEALAEAIEAKHWETIDDYMEAITDWQEEYGL